MTALMDKRVAEWLASDDTGSSSTTILLWMGASVGYGKWGGDVPYDCGDLGRCMRLLERFPEWKPRMAAMAGAGGLWPTFSTRWPEIVASYVRECGGAVPAKGKYVDCPNTYQLLKEVRDAAYAADKPEFTEIKVGEGMSIRFGK